MARLLFRLGTGAHRHRLLVVGIWLLVLVAAGVGSATLAGSTTSTFNIPGQESTTALDLIKRAFGSAAGGGATAQVVVKAPAGQTLTAGPAAASVEDLVGTLKGLPGVVSATDPLAAASPTVSPDRSTAYSTVTYRGAAGSVTAAQQEALTRALADARGSGLTVEASGEATQATETGGGGSIGEAAGVVVALVVLAVTYGALAIAGMNLLTALIGVGVGFLGIQIATGFLTLSATTPALATMLGLAVGIDYALFIVTRFRQELRRGLDVRSAVGVATGTAGSAVVTAGVTVVIALVGLFVTGIPFLTQMGIAAAGTIVVAVLIALTLVPAVLSLLGTRALPRRQRRALAAGGGGRHEAPAEQPAAPAREGRGFFTGWIGGVVRHRTLTLLAAVVALAVIAVPLLSMRTTLVQTPAEDTTQARAEQLLTNAFGAGFNGPLTVFFDGSGALQAATTARPELARLADVVTVTPPVPNQAGNAALLTVVPRSGPTSAATEDLVTSMRKTLSGIDGARPYVTGSTAVSVDVASTLNHALPVYLVLVVGLAFVLLVLVFRSLLVPLVGVLGFLLTIGASIGATVAVFQWGWLDSVLGVGSHGPLLSLAPILVIGILFGLAMDYQVFLVSRMHEAHGHGADNRTSITTGFRQAAPVVVAAATIMFSVFTGFFTGGDATIKQIAFALAAGILFDAFVVRMVLVPAAMALLGERSWWLPRWLRWLPELDVEGTAIERDATPAAPEPVAVATS